MDFSQRQKSLRGGHPNQHFNVLNQHKRDAKYSQKITQKFCGFRMMAKTNDDYISKLVEQANSSQNWHKELSNDESVPTLDVPDAPKRKFHAHTQIKVSLSQPSDRPILLSK